MKYSALIGNPVEHSISPEMFDLLSKKLKIEYAHLKITVEDKKDLKQAINSMCNLGFVGFNITCPYKLDILKLIDECDKEAEKIKSINSVVIRDGKTKGYNTDGKAAILSIKHFYNITPDDKVVIIGAGGAAYPIFYELLKITNNIKVFNRSLDNAKKMCEIIDHSIECYALSDKDKLIDSLKEATLIINTTSVGMHPNNEDTLIDESMFKEIINNNTKCFFDVIFNPWDTKIIENAKKYNQIAVSGGYMLIYQAILVLQLWLGKELDISNEEVDILAEKMIEVLNENYS